MKMFEIVIGYKSYIREGDFDNKVENVTDKSKSIVKTIDFDRAFEKSKGKVFKENKDDASISSHKYFQLVDKLNKTFKKYNNETSSIFAISFNRGYLTLISRIASDYERQIKRLINKVFDVVSEKCVINDYNTIVVECEHESKYREISTTEFFVEKIRDCMEDNHNCDEALRMVKEYFKEINENGYSFRDLSDRADVLNLDFLVTLNIGNKLTKTELQNKYYDLFYNKDFSEEIDRIYDSKSINDIKINPVHYIIRENDANQRKKYYECIGTALYSVGRVKNRKAVKFNICIGDNYISNQSIVFLLKNSFDSFVAIDFISYRARYTVSDYNSIDGESNLKELTDIISLLKDKIQFAFSFDKYNKEMEDKILERLHPLTLVNIESKINKIKVNELVDRILLEKGLGKNDKLDERLKYVEGSITKFSLEKIIDDWEKEEVVNKYYPNYTKFYKKEESANIDFDPYKELMGMIGLSNVKDIFKQILDTAKLDRIKKEKFLESKKSDLLSENYAPIDEPLHMAFMGNPGTAKTTVAKLFAKILYQNGIIRSPKTIEYNSEPGKSLEKAFERAYGGVLFIDEAYQYSIVPGFRDTLCDLMEEERGNVIVILAGYYDEMRCFIEGNPGLESRIKYKIKFENYDEEELWKILKYMLPKMQLCIDESDENSIKEKLLPVFSSAQVEDTFGNGRLIRNILDTAKGNAAKRLMSGDINLDLVSYEELNTLKINDFDMDYKMITGTTIIPYVNDPKTELDNLIGLKKAKELINMLVFRVKMAKGRIPMHLAFLGNPGTGKTTVARLLACILKKYGIIKKSNIIEVGRKDLVSRFLGGTSPNIVSAFERAKGGILFIDEAYSLIDDYKGGYGEEAINTIVQEMENKRDDVIVILAGYTDRMKELIDNNEGMQSRISYYIDFEDYNSDEMLTIFDKMVLEKNLIIEDEARLFLKERLEYLSNTENYGKLGNARYIRRLVEKIILNKDYRLAKLEKDTYTDSELSLVVKSDIEKAFVGEMIVNEQKSSVGFAA